MLIFFTNSFYLFLFWSPVKVLEVFGPVSKPLYTVRLPEAPDTISNQGKKCSPKKDSLRNKEDKNENFHTKDDEENKAKTDTVDEICENTSYDIATKSNIEKSDQISSSNDNEMEEKLKKTYIQESNAVCNVTDQDDPWSKDGKYTKLIQSNQQMAVFFCQDRVKTIDTQMMVKNRKKGSGKSFK